MSDTAPIPDAAIAALQARVAELNIEIERHNQALLTTAAIRNELHDMIKVLSRKPRESRKPRPATETRAANDEADEAPRPTVFAAPCASGDTAEAA